MTAADEFARRVHLRLPEGGRGVGQRLSPETPVPVTPFPVDPLLRGAGRSPRYDFPPEAGAVEPQAPGPRDGRRAFSWDRLPCGVCVTPVQVSVLPCFLFPNTVPITRLSLLRHPLFCRRAPGRLRSGRAAVNVGVPVLGRTRHFPRSGRGVESCFVSQEATRAPSQAAAPHAQPHSAPSRRRS